MKKVLLLIIFVIGFSLRIFFLNSIPSELNRDEVSVGYNAYSLLSTGKDEHGRGPWPLVFRAFGDYKIPGYIYMAIPLIKLFGLNAFTVRLPAALFGSLTILIIYKLIKELFAKESFALFTSFLLTFSPFHLQYSRQQFEATVALFFSLTGLLFLLKARKQSIFLLFSLFMLIISFFTYNAPLFIVPLLVSWTMFIYRQDLFNKRIKGFKIVIFLALLFISLIGYWSLAKEGNKGRANTTIFNQESLKDSVDLNIHYLTIKGIPLWLTRISNNKLLYLLSDYLKNYLSAFNPKFIFFTSDNNPWHSLGFLNYGNILIIFLPILVVGLIVSNRQCKLKEFQWLFGYLFIAPIANGLTIDSPILTRLLDFHTALIIFTAIGLDSILNKYRLTNFNKLKNTLIIGLISISTVTYLTSYFLIFPQYVAKEDFWLTGIKEISQIVKKNESKYDYIFLDSKAEVGYIFFAFYLPFNPEDFQSKAVWKSDGFEKVKSFDKYIFDKDSNELNKIDKIKSEYGSGMKILLIEKLPFRSHSQKLDYRSFIYNSLGDPIWQLTSITT